MYVCVSVCVGMYVYECVCVCVCAYICSSLPLDEIQQKIFYLISYCSAVNFNTL